MAKLSHAESKRLYSWWWDSHISPKNSKWLQENLTDMDSKVKSMIKLIEEDADSFRKRAEMYYRKRPELLKLVEEFYRAYRALAERYDHATGALRQAHRTMAEAFPDQMPTMIPDESPYGSSCTDADSLTPETLSHGRALSDFTVFQKDALDMSLQSTTSRRNDVSTEGNDAATSRGLKQAKTEGEENHKKFTNGWPRKRLNFQIVEGINVGDEVHQEVQLLADKDQNRKNQHPHESEHAAKAEAEFGNLKGVISELESEKKIVSLQLEEEMQRLNKETSSLNQQICSSELKIKCLQEEISLLEESKRKFEIEVGLHVEEKESLQQDVLSIKADKKALEQRHIELIEQISVVNSNVESLQAMVKELRDDNVELKELCKKHEDERTKHLESLEFMENITEQKVVLEISLSNALVELEELRKKVKTLEESCEALCKKISVHMSEKAVLLSQIREIEHDMANLSDKNVSLESSLSDANTELEGLSGKLSALEKSFQSLHDQNSILIAEKAILVAQVESISHCLENLEDRYAELEGKNLNLVQHKDHILIQSSKLQHSLRIQKEEYESVMQSTRSQLNDLESQIRILEEKVRLREDEAEEDHHKIANAQIETFILQRILHDMKENNILLSDRCQKYLETSTCQEELISELKRETCIQWGRLTSLSKHNKKLVEGIHQLMGKLDINKECQSPDDLNLKLLLSEIEDLKASVLDVQDDNQHLVLEKSVLLTLLKQYGLNLAELQSKKEVLERESKTRLDELLVSRSEKHQLLELNVQLRQYVQTCNRKEEILKAETEILSKRSSDLQEVHSKLQGDITKLIEENQTFAKKINDLSVRNNTLEENNNALVAELASLEHLYLYFRSYSTERALEVKLINNRVDQLCGVNNGLEQEIKSLNAKLKAVEVEIMHLNASLVNLEECKRHLMLLEDEVKVARETCQELDCQVQMGNNILLQKDMELIQLNRKLQIEHDKNTALSEEKEGLMKHVDNFRATGEELEKKNLALMEFNSCRDTEIMDLHHARDALNIQVNKLFEEVNELKDQEKQLSSELENGVKALESYEVEIEALLSDIHIKTIEAAICQEKMLELLIASESLEISAIVQKEMVSEEITRRNVYEDELKETLDVLGRENRGLKEELSAYLPLIRSLGSLVASLERRILPLSKHSSLHNQEKKDYSRSLQQKRSKEDCNEDHYASSPHGILELQKLHAKVNTLEEVVADVGSHLEYKYVPEVTSLAAATDGQGLESKESAEQGQDIILHLKKKDATSKGNAEICEDKSELMMKDIELDHVLSSSLYGTNGASSHVPRSINGTNDQIMELWETIDGNKMEKPSPRTSERDLVCHQIEVEPRMNEPELIKKTESLHAWSGSSVSDRLSSDAQRLSALQKNAKELKRIMETSDLSDAPANYEYRRVRAQLKDAEAVIVQLLDTNSKLTRKANKLSSSSESDEFGSSSGRKISERARKGSEKIGRVELELQKLEYIWLKLKEEHDYRKARAAERRTRVMLRDYFYGRRESPRRKKVHCACFRPRTKDE